MRYRFTDILDLGLRTLRLISGPDPGLIIRENCTLCYAVRVR